MHHISLADIRPERWRNGGGLTQPLLTWPEGSGSDDWQLRISVAHIAQAGPFSAFPGIDRWFAVLIGAGVVLQFVGRTEVIGEDSPALAFDGAAAPGCELIEGPTLDLNLMTRRDAGQGEMRRALVGEPWLSHGSFRALYCSGAATLRVGEDEAHAFADAGLLWSPAAAQQRWMLEDLGPGAHAWWLSFKEAAA